MKITKVLLYGLQKYKKIIIAKLKILKIYLRIFTLSTKIHKSNKTEIFLRSRRKMRRLSDKEKIHKYDYNSRLKRCKDCCNHKTSIRISDQQRES